MSGGQTRECRQKHGLGGARHARVLTDLPARRTRDNRWLVMPRCTQPSQEVQILLDKLRMELPKQPPPRIKAPVIGSFGYEISLRVGRWDGETPRTPTVPRIFTLVVAKNRDMRFLTSDRRPNCKPETTRRNHRSRGVNRLHGV